MQPPPLASIQFPDYRGQDLLLLGALLRSLLQDSSDRFSELQDRVNLERHNVTLQRKLYFDELQQIRWKYLRFYIIVAWLEKHQARINRLGILHKIIDKSEGTFHYAWTGFWELENEFRQWCGATWDVGRAVHVLGTGSYRLLPLIIKEKCDFVSEFDEEKEKEIIENLQQKIRYKLISSTLPPNLKLNKLEEGMVELEMPGEYKLSMSLRMTPQQNPRVGDDERIRWSLFDLEILTRTAKLDTKQKKSKNNVQIVINKRQCKHLLALVNEKIRNELDIYKTGKTNRDTLMIIHEMLHAFVLKLIMKVLKKQLLILKAEMGDNINIISKENHIILELWDYEDLNSMKLDETEKNENKKINKNKKIKTEIWNERGTLHVSHNPKIQIYDRKDIERFGINRSCINLPEMIRNVAILYANLRLCQLVEKLEEKWKNRVSIHDIKTKQKVGLDKMGRTYGLLCVKAHLLCEHFATAQINRLTGEVLIQANGIKKHYIDLANEIVSEKLENFQKSLELLRARIVINHISVVAQAANILSYTESPFSHTMKDKDVCFIRTKKFPFTYFIFHYISKTGEILCYQENGKNRNFFHEKGEAIEKSNVGQKLLENLQKDGNTPLVNQETLKELIETSSNLNYTAQFHNLLESSKLPYRIDGKIVILKINNENIYLDLSNLPKVTYTHIPSIGLSSPDLHSLIIGQDICKDRVVYVIDVTVPISFEKLIQLIIQLQILKKFEEQFIEFENNIAGYRMISRNLLPLRIELESMSSQGIIRILQSPESESKYLHEDVLPITLEADPPLLNLPFLEDTLLENEFQLYHVLEKVNNLSYVYRIFNATVDMFKHNLKKWRPGWSEKILLTIQPTSENSILLKHGERRIELCCENKNHILMKRFVKIQEDDGTLIYKLKLQRIPKQELPKVILRMIINGGLNSVQKDPELGEKYFNSLKPYNITSVSLDIFRIPEPSYPPKLEFFTTRNGEFNETFKNILRQYYVQHICHPISRKSINYFACLLYFINYSADAKQPERWISLVHHQLQIYSQMAKSTFKKRFSFCQLNMAMNPMYLNKKENVNWIFFAIDFLQVSPTNNQSFSYLPAWSRYQVDDSVTIRFAVQHRSNIYGTWRGDETHEEIKLLDDLMENQSGQHIGALMSFIQRTFSFADLRKKFAHGFVNT